eukprot:1011815-Amphidinium_carterae.1
MFEQVWKGTLFERARSAQTWGCGTNRRWRLDAKLLQLVQCLLLRCLEYSIVATCPLSGCACEI